MTHEELLAKINHMWNDDFDYVASCHTNALRAVVELHKPITIELCDDLDCCGCGDHDFIFNDCQSNEYPCPTIQAIQKELK